jgi:glycine/D-amino acid oxidase-like deaminating enzyme
MKFIPCWLDTSPPGPDRSGTEIGGRVDVAIVGGGLTGLSAALHLARKGANVQVLEQETVGWGASGRNGGMATGGLGIGFRDAVARYGLETAARYIAVLLAQAFAQESDLLPLDEPTPVSTRGHGSTSPPRSPHARTYGVTIIHVTHDLDEASRAATACCSRAAGYPKAARAPFSSGFD